MIVRLVRKLIVYLTVRVKRGEPDPRQYVVRIFGETNDGAPYTGTGFLLNSNGYVATCLHVVEKAREIFVQLPYTEEWIYKICAKEELEDLAVLEGHVKPSLPTPSATLHCNWFDGSKVGREVALWGYSGAATAGSSALRFNCHISGVSGRFGLIMLDGHVNPGDSGGPLINADGHVIGIANFKDTKRDGHAMARPISRLYELLKKHKHIDFNSRIGGGYFAEQAITSLGDPTRVQRVLEAAREYTSVFEKASSQVSIIHAHKRVHDLLHEVEFLCYEGLIIAAPPSFPEKDSARKHVKIYLFQLKKHLSQADDILSRITKHQGQVANVRDQLREAYNALKEADDKLDPELCSCAISLLRDLLWGPDQSNFNVLLKVAARELNMDGLVTAMQSVQEVISRTEPGTAKKFQWGVDDLAELSRALHLRIDEHDKWQEVDDLLRTFHGNNPELLSQLEFQRKRLMSRLGAACDMSGTIESQSAAETSASAWASPLMHEATELDKAVATGNLTEARLHLGQLRQHVADRFYETDKKLRELCELISHFEVPLRTVVNNL